MGLVGEELGLHYGWSMGGLRYCTYIASGWADVYRLESSRHRFEMNSGALFRRFVVYNMLRLEYIPWSKCSSFIEVTSKPLDASNQPDPLTKPPDSAINSAQSPRQSCQATLNLNIK